MGSPRTRTRSRSPRRPAALQLEDAGASGSAVVLPRARRPAKSLTPVPLVASPRGTVRCGSPNGTVLCGSPRAAGPSPSALPRLVLGRRAGKKGVVGPMPETWARCGLLVRTADGRSAKVVSDGEAGPLAAVVPVEAKGSPRVHVQRDHALTPVVEVGLMAELVRASGPLPRGVLGRVVQTQEGGTATFALGVSKSTVTVALQDVCTVAS